MRIVEESKNMEGEGWGRFSGAAVPWAYRTNTQKVRDVKEMALTHVPSPQRDVYLNLANSCGGSYPDNQASETKV